MFNPTIGQAWSIAFDWCRWNNLRGSLKEIFTTFSKTAGTIAVAAIIPALLLGGVHTLPLFAQPLVLLLALSNCFVGALSVLSCYGAELSFGLVTRYALALFVLNPHFLSTAYLSQPPTINFIQFILMFLFTTPEHNFLSRCWTTIKNCFWAGIYFMPIFVVVSLPVFPLVWVLPKLFSASYLYMIFFHLSVLLSSALTITIYRKIFQLIKEDPQVVTEGKR